MPGHRSHQDSGFPPIRMPGSDRGPARVARGCVREPVWEFGGVGHVVDGAQDDGVFGRPPPVDRLLADAGAGGYGFDRKSCVAGFDT